MPLSISFRFSTVILGLLDKPLTPRPYPVELLADRVSKAAGVVVKPFRPGCVQPCEWHIARSFIAEPRAGGTGLVQNYPDFFAANFISPVYYEANRVEWKDDVSLVLSTVGEYAYWRPNPVLGFHTFVRLGLREKFTLRQLKRIAMLVCRFEEAIDTLPPVQRRIKANKKLILSNLYDNPAFQNHTIAEIYALIQAVPTIPQLCSLLNNIPLECKNPRMDPSHPGYNATIFFKVNIAPSGSCVHFFQYESTTSAEPAIKWGEFVLRFVEYAMSASEAAIMTGGNTIEDLARLVDLP